MKKLRKIIPELSFVLPALILYILFVIYPLVDAFHYSLTDWNGVNNNFNFIGLKNYINMFSDAHVMGPLKNTFVYAFLCMILLNILGLIFAVGLDNLTKGKNILRACLFVPAVLSPLIVGYIFSFIFSVPVADLGRNLEIQALANNILGDKRFALIAVVFVTCWKMAGWYMVVYIAGLQSIDASLYEAADIDGATNWEKFWKVTFPLIAPAFTINMVLSIERSFKQYDMVLSLTGGGPGRASELLALTIYNEEFTNKRGGYGCALGIVLFLIIVAVTLFQMKFLRRRENDINY